MFVRAVVMLAMRRAVAWRVFISVPRILDKIDLLAAGTIRAAVLRPMFGVTRRYAQIDGRFVDVPAWPFDDNRLGIDHRWRAEVADVEATVELVGRSGSRRPRRPPSLTRLQPASSRQLSGFSYRTLCSCGVIHISRVVHGQHDRVMRRAATGALVSG